MSKNYYETIHNIIANYQTANYQKITVYGIVTYIGSRNSKQLKNLYFKFNLN